MFFKEKRFKIFEPVYALSDNPEDSLRIFKGELNRIIGNLGELLEVDFENIDGVELYEKMKEVFNIYIEEKDFLKMFSIKNGRNYVRGTDISTNIEFSPIFSEESWQLFFRVIVADGVRMKEGPYRIGKLERMVAKKDIVLMHSYANEIPFKTDIKSPEITKEQRKRLSCYEIYSDYPTHISCTEKFIYDNPKLFTSIVKNSLTEEQLLIGAKGVLTLLQDEVDDILNVNSDDRNVNEVAQSCRNWFNSFSKKDSFVELNKTLTREKQN